MIDTGTLNLLWSQTLVTGLVAAGATHAIISPGSRSTPLALAMLRQTGLECTVAVDERCAAFFALGIAKASRQPVLVLATSGTALANWLPAVIEASQAGVPLILISADRPPELQGCGANQTINQVGLFGSHVRACHDLGTPEAAFDPDYLHRLAARIYEQTVWPYPGPVHVNQPFREPLVPSGDIPAIQPPGSIRWAPPALHPAPEVIAELSAAIAGRPGIIVCGEQPPESGFADALAALAEHLDCPILAEPLSNMRFGPHDRTRLCVRYNRWLADRPFAASHHPQWVLRFGAFPVTRHLQDYVASATATHALVEPWPRWTDPTHRLTHLLRAAPLAVCQALLAAAPAPTPAGWRAAFADREQTVPAAIDAGHIAVLIDEVAADTPLFIGNSLAIRQLDSYSGHGGKTLHFHGNRGASGIDGNISTALGIAAVHGRIVALLGDLTTQHDLGGLALAAGRDAIIVTVNNGGGGIFDLLPQAALPEFEPGWRTPQQISFEHAALTFGLGYARADDNDAFRTALRHAIADGGPQLIELLVP
ncbi:2-succinyl-5-enolpyruvyl-6-hydroxy-3-cyclohexene-1-carboxylic-acid synthase [Dechloromonas sp. A34]|uniref:2-succinyl-5-enolpyruvyl-6-hydroxy-3- cyclohexene-1-carboxylic-acid synthase n=1 Tax=Dechloromonas sp. A34 TaxID=447588 RepID=UPI0022493CE7|nr:2-succinyl-5-enolpyruvyl-6-hydroxy-3-cyclohexene-1-carboxylic-acid synthase [Dechloromonas sp. A34]